MQFPSYCKPKRLTVKYLNVGFGWVQTNGFSFYGNILRTTDVQFITEQDGYGAFFAKYNGAILKCQGFAAYKRKKCTIPKNLRPWGGVITVSMWGPPSSSFRLNGKPGMYILPATLRLSRGLGRVVNLIILKIKYYQKKDNIKISTFAKFGDV